MPGSCLCLSRSILFCVLFFKGTYEAASLAGLGQEAAERSVYMPWPQSGRMQYEENKKNPIPLLLVSSLDDLTWSLGIGVIRELGKKGIGMPEARSGQTLKRQLWRGDGTKTACLALSLGDTPRHDLVRRAFISAKRKLSPTTDAPLPVSK
jgi:hypothetical protein